MNNHSIFAVVVSTLALSSVASADLVTVAGTGVGAGRNVNVTHGTTTGNVFAGQIRLTLSNSTGFDLNGTWTSFCTELNQHIEVGGAAQTYTVLPVHDLPTPSAGMGTTRADAIARMYAAANFAQFGTNNDIAAAFQISVWEVSMDYDGTSGSLNTNSGTFKGNSLSDAISGHVATFLSAAANTGGTMSSIIGIGSTTKQDQILDLSNGIPAPGAMALLGLAGIVGTRRRK
jgi:hypothetical protein